MTLILSYYCKQKYLASTHAETTAKDVLLFVLNMPVPASPLLQNFKQVIEK